VKDFMAHLSTVRAASTANMTYRALQQLFGRMMREDDIERSPMEKMRPPLVPEVPAPVLIDDQLRAILAICKGKTFVDRRDTAIIRLFIDIRMPPGRDRRSDSGRRGYRRRRDPRGGLGPAAAAGPVR
jgi:site-specific recombinase XerC